MSEVSRSLKKFEDHLEFRRLGYIAEADALVLGQASPCVAAYTQLKVSPTIPTSTPIDVLAMFVYDRESYIQVEYDNTVGEPFNWSQCFEQLANMLNESTDWLASYDSGTSEVIVQPRDGVPRFFVVGTGTIGVLGTRVMWPSEVNVQYSPIYTNPRGDRYSFSNPHNEQGRQKDRGSLYYGLFAESINIPGNEGWRDYVVFDENTCQIIQDTIFMVNMATSETSIQAYPALHDSIAFDLSLCGKMYNIEEEITQYFDEELNRHIIKFKHGHGLPDLPGNIPAFTVPRRDAREDAEGFYGSRALYYQDENTLFCPFNDLISRFPSHNEHFVIAAPIVKYGEGSGNGNALALSFTFDPDAVTYCDW